RNCQRAPRADRRVFAQRRPDPLAQYIRCLERRHACLDSRTQRETPVAKLDALAALGDVRFQLTGLDCGELAVEVGVELRFEVRMTHISTPQPRTALAVAARGRGTIATSRYPP